MSRPKHAETNFALRNIRDNPLTFGRINILYRIGPLKEVKVGKFLGLVKTARRGQGAVFSVNFAVKIPVKRRVNRVAVLRMIGKLDRIEIIAYRDFKIVQVMYAIMGEESRKRF